MNLHLIDLNAYSSEEIESILSLAEEINISPQTYSGALTGKVMATLFYEPSTRTQMSFQSAMLRLGGGIIGYSDPSVTSETKGENLKDTIKIISGYSDLIAMRSPQEGSVKAAAAYSDCPVINAGDGSHLHPTQTLTDLATIKHFKKRLDGLHIGAFGDLKYGRTVHSLAKAMSRYKNTRFTFVSSEALRCPDYIKNAIIKSGNTYSEVICDKTTDPKFIGNFDVLYMTRIQRERFESPQDYEIEKNNQFVLNPETIKFVGQNAIILHPLPRLDEIDPRIDGDERAKYFEQANIGMRVRMALILRLLTKTFEPKRLIYGEEYDLECSNPKCVTKKEKYLPKLFVRTGNDFECEYCEAGSAGGQMRAEF